MIPRRLYVVLAGLMLANTMFGFWLCQNTTVHAQVHDGNITLRDPWGMVGTETVLRTVIVGDRRCVVLIQRSLTTTDRTVKLNCSP